MVKFEMERKKALYVGAICIGVLMLVTCLLLRDTRTSKQDIAPPKIESKEIAVCIGADPQIIDPTLSYTANSNNLVLHCFEGLMTRDKEGNLIPGVAEKYGVSEDGLIYTFKIRKDAKWSDGQPVTAMDFVYSWNRAVDPKAASPNSSLFDVVKRKNGEKDGKLDVEAVDNTLVVKLKNKAPYFTELCSFVTFCPLRKDIIEKHEGKWTFDPSTYICNGPFKISEWKTGAHIIQKKNEKYWNKDHIKLDKIKFVLMEDDAAALSAFKRKSILFTSRIPTSELASLQGTPELQLTDILETDYVCFNTEIIDNKLVRKALTLAVDRNRICEALKSGEKPAGAYIPPGFKDVDPKKSFRDVGRKYYDLDDYKKNLELAKQTLVEAGYPEGKGLPRYEYLYIQNTRNKLVAEALKFMWEEIGAIVDLRTQETNSFYDACQNGKFQMAWNRWLSDYSDPISMLELWIAGDTRNYSRQSNPKYDDLIKQVKASSDVEEQKKLMHQAEDLIFDNWLLCPVSYGVTGYLVSEKLKDVYMTPLGSVSFVYSYVI